MEYHVKRDGSARTLHVHIYIMLYILHTGPHTYNAAELYSKVISGVICWARACVSARLPAGAGRGVWGGVSVYVCVCGGAGVNGMNARSMTKSANYVYRQLGIYCVHEPPGQWRLLCAIRRPQSDWTVRRTAQSFVQTVILGVGGAFRAV